MEGILRTCKYKNKTKCQLDHKSTTNKIVYSWEVKTDIVIPEQLTKIYFGISEAEFKTSYNNHTYFFRNLSHEKEIELLKYGWGLKDQDEVFFIRGTILTKD